jgi:hypothetical protein
MTLPVPQAAWQVASGSGVASVRLDTTGRVDFRSPLQQTLQFGADFASIVGDMGLANGAAVV